jgi:glucokinase
VIVAGDIGGTKTLLALAEAGADGLPAIRFERRYASRDHGEFEPLLARFLAEAAAAGHACGTLAHASFGVAGPVSGRRVKPTYLPWTLDADALAAGHGIGGVTLVNDFAAAAAGVLTVGPQHLVTLQAGEPRPQAPKVVVGAGTGLGVAFLIWSGTDWQIVAGEGGHAGFAPADEEQAALWRHLHLRYRRVTAERVVSGLGLFDIYRFLVEERGWAADTPDPAHAPDPPAAVAAAAARGGAAAVRAMEIFVHAYGAFAGDLALTVLARGGVYVAGGIAARILPWLRGGRFVAGFTAKEGHATLAAAMPLHVVTEEQLGLHGAAWIALRRAA